MVLSLVRERAHYLSDRTPLLRLHGACRHNVPYSVDLLAYSAVTRRAAPQAFRPQPREARHRLHQNAALPKKFPSATDHRSDTRVKVSLYQQNACNHASGYRQPNPVIRPPNSRDWIIKRKWEKPQVRNLVCALAGVENKV